MILLSKAVDSYLREYLPVEVRRSKGTIKTIRLQLKAFSGSVGDRELDSITLSDCRTFIRLQSEKRINNNTLNKYLSALKNFFKYCELEGWTHFNPCLRIGSLKEDTKIVQALTKGELYQVINHRLPYKQAKKQLWERDHTLMMLIASTGLRPSEAAGLKWKDINFEEQYIRVRPEVGKGRKERLIPLINETASLLYFKYDREKPMGNDPLFVNIIHGHPITPKTINIIFKKIVVNCGITRLDKPTVYLLRKSYITHLYQDGVNIMSIASLAGHSNPAVTYKHYIQNNDLPTLRDEVLAKSFLNHTPKSTALAEFQKEQVRREGYVVKQDTFKAR